MLAGITVRMPKTEIHREVTPARHMRPDRIEHGFTVPTFVPTSVDELAQIAATLRALPGIGPLDCRSTVVAHERIGPLTSSRDVIAQEIDKIPHRRKPKTEDLRVLSRVDRFIDPPRPKSCRNLFINHRRFRTVAIPKSRKFATAFRSLLRFKAVGN